MATRILWQRVDRPGHEISVLEPHAGGWQLVGTAIFAQEKLPCELKYRIECDDRWQTRSASISGYVGTKSVSLDCVRQESGAWRFNDERVPEVDWCVDIDLGFSPSTNLLPIRRLALSIGSSAKVGAAWVRFPELSVEALEQVYTRLDENRYLYESGDGSFRRELLIGLDGFVVEYPGYWHAEAITNFG
jgi:hypothetical protein